jgi:hypothetical protein
VTKSGDRYLKNLPHLLNLGPISERELEVTVRFLDKFWYFGTIIGEKNEAVDSL